MTNLKRCLFMLLLLSGQCFADMAVKDQHFLYYLNTGHGAPNLYYGKYIRETQTLIELDKLTEVQVDGCPADYTPNLICKINAFFQADKNNRADMLKVQVNKRVMVPLAQAVVFSVD